MITKSAIAPRASDVYVEPSLTNFSQKLMQDADNFVAGRLFPSVPVVKQSGKYFNYDADDLRRIEVKERAPNTEVQVAGFRVATDPYDCKQWALGRDVDEEMVANADVPIRPFTDATQYLTHQFMLHKEQIVTSRIFKANTWTTTGVQGAKWDDYGNANSNPIVDIRDTKRAIQDITGIKANRLVLGREAYDKLVDHPLILDRVKGGATTMNPALVMKERLAHLFELEQVEVADAIHTTSNRGKSKANTTRARFVTDKAVLYHAPMSVSLGTPTAASFFSWTQFSGANEEGVRIEVMPIHHRYTDRVSGRSAYDFKVCSPDLGAYWGDTNG